MDVESRRGKRFRRARPRLTLAAHAVAGIVPGDHVCASFASDDEQRALVARYARQALRRGERFLYLVHNGDDATIRSWLAGDGIDIDAGLALGQIEIRRIDASGDGIDPEALIAALQADRRAAKADGYSALCATSEMSWGVAAPAQVDAAERYECGVGRVFAAADVAGLCQYDRRLFAAGVLERLVATHDFQLCVDGDVTTTARRRLTISEHADGAVALAGALDIDSSAYVIARLSEVEREGDLVVRTSGLGFADIAGCRSLLRAAEALDGDRRLMLPDPAPSLVRVLQLCGWSENGRLVVR